MMRSDENNGSTTSFYSDYSFFTAATAARGGTGKGNAITIEDAFAVTSKCGPVRFFIAITSLVAIIITAIAMCISTKHFFRWRVCIPKCSFTQFHFLRRSYDVQPQPKVGNEVKCTISVGVCKCSLYTSN
eukprot:12187104-Ditylum_brightwellii.AAC.2